MWKGGLLPAVGTLHLLGRAAPYQAGGLPVQFGRRMRCCRLCQGARQRRGWPRAPRLATAALAGRAAGRARCRRSLQQLRPAPR